MALGGPLAHSASHSVSRVAAGVGRKVSCWVALRHLLLVLAATHPTVLVFAVFACCVAAWTGFRIVAGAMGCGGRAEWLQEVRLG